MRLRVLPPAPCCGTCRLRGNDESAGSYERAAAEHQLIPAHCFVIGDSPDDVRAARRLGARGCLVRTGWASDPRVVETAAPDASVVVRSLDEAVDWILNS